MNRAGKSNGCSTVAANPAVRRPVMPRGENGQAFVELALVLPMLTLIVLGIVEFGRLAYAAIEVSNAARAGVAYAAQSVVFASNGPGITQAAKADGQDGVVVKVLNVQSPATLTCYCEDSTGNITQLSSCTVTNTNPAACSVPPNRVLVDVQVNTSANVDTLFHFPGIPNTLTFTGQATMRVGQ